MKILLKYSIFGLLVLSSCSAMYNDLIYKGNYKGKDIVINFQSTKRGYILVANKDSIPFNYKIEKYKKGNDSSDTKKVRLYVYRFFIGAEYDIDFPLGLFEIGQKRGRIIQVNDSLTFVRQ